MASILASQVVRPSIRHFSAHRPRPDSRAARAVAMGCIVSGVVLPFVPPALESSRQRSSGIATSANRHTLDDSPSRLGLSAQAPAQDQACDVMHYAQGVRVEMVRPLSTITMNGSGH
ncbi:hypothetical protein PENNAL_c0037G08777 [Penicillium nalgiovense]|uniref:Uncharacterized protein n=2 Tax=Penicillium TaxID=5073 RepID=A0A1V6Y4C6_PENNA|nr:hypothetical protein PENNAL_c0037G08777 [Penicillium nalgiovense]